MMPHSVASRNQPTKKPAGNRDDFRPADVYLSADKICELD